MLCLAAQSCLTLCNPMDCGLPGISVHGILQARTLEWVAISFSNAWKWKVKVKSLSRTRLLETPWTAAYQAPQLPCPPLGDLSYPGIEPRSSTVQADSLLSEPPGKPKNTGVGSRSFLRGIFPTQESNQGLLHCRQIIYQLSYQGSPRLLEWVAYPISRGSPPPRNWTRVFCIAMRILYHLSYQGSP